MSKVFVSYARQERRWAQWVSDALKPLGYTVWWDRDLVVGDQFASTIRAELDASQAVVVLWSDASWKSSWVQAEALAAHDAQKLINVRIGSIRLGVPFNAIQSIDLDLDREPEKTLADIAQAIASIVSRSSTQTDMSKWIDEQFEDLPRGEAVAALTARSELLRDGSWDRSRSKATLEHQALSEHDAMALVWLADILWARAMPNDRFRARTIVANMAAHEVGMAGDFAAERHEKWAKNLRD